MSHRSSRHAVLAALLAVTLLTSSVAGVAFAATPSNPDVQRTDTPDGDEVIDSFVERLSTLETVEFTRTTESTFDNETTTRTVRVHADLEATQKRVETINVSQGTNTTRVVNESAVVSYNGDDNTVSKYEVSGEQTLLPTLEALANESLVSYAYAGTDTVDGTDVYLLEATPELAEDAETTLTIAVDTETYFPVRLTSATTGEEYEYQSTMTYTNVTLDEEIPASTFDLDVPEDATDPSAYVPPNITSYEHYGNLSTAVDLSLPAAELPADFEFEHGTVVDGDEYYSVSLSYTDGETTLSISVRPDEFGDSIYENSDRYETVEIGETTGYRYVSDDFTSLQWGDDLSYSLYGELENGTATDVAESIVAD